MVKKVFLFTVALVVFSCEAEEEIPEGILSEKQMIELLIDIRVAEGKVVNLSLSKDSATVLYKALEKRVFESYQVDSADYTKSYNYYLLNPRKFLSINNVVLDSLKVRQQILTTGRRSTN